MDCLSRYDYNQIKAQMDKMEALTFGAKITVLLVSDRLRICARGLQEYLQNSTDIVVELAYTLDGAVSVIRKKHIDFLIFVGYQENSDNYKAKEVLEKYDKQAVTIIFALLSYAVMYDALTFNIKLKYDRYKPIDGFVEYMRKLYEVHGKPVSWFYRFSGIVKRLCL